MRPMFASALALTAVLLAGCGTGPIASQARLAPASLAAKANGAAYHQVLPGEALGWNEVSEAAHRFMHEQQVLLPLGPKGERERVSSLMPHDLAGRRLAGGAREIVGVMTIYGDHVPNTFITHQKRMPFKMRFGADQTLTKFEFEGVKLDGLKVLKPEFQPVTAAERDRLEADVLAFIEPRATGGDNVFTALFGKSNRYTATIAGIKATQGAFGEHGRVLELQIPLRNKGGGLFHTYTFTALLDERGQVTSVK